MSRPNRYVDTQKKKIAEQGKKARKRMNWLESIFKKGKVKNEIQKRS